MQGWHGVFRGAGMKKLIERLIRNYGTDMEITTGGETVETRGFLQLVTSKSWQNMERMVSTGGEIPRGQFLYVGPPDLKLKGRDIICVGEHNYIVRRADAIIYRNQPLFIWGLCVEGGEPWTL